MGNHFDMLLATQTNSATDMRKLSQIYSIRTKQILFRPVKDEVHCEPPTRWLLFFFCGFQKNRRRVASDRIVSALRIQADLIDDAAFASNRALL